MSLARQSSGKSGGLHSLIRCLFFIGLPLCLLTMAFGQGMGWSVYRVRTIALPISIALSFGVSNYVATKNKNVRSA